MGAGKGDLSRTTALCCIGSGLLLLVMGLSATWHGSPIGLALFAGGSAALAWAVAGLVQPWIGARTTFRVRYHAPTQPATLGPALLAIAQATELGIRVIWQRLAGELMLYLDVPAGAGEVLAERITHLLPEGQLEPIISLPAVVVGGFYRWSLQAGEEPIALSPAVLLESATLDGDFEIFVHLVAGGGAVLVHGSPGLQNAMLRPFWRMFWRKPAGIVALVRHYPLIDPWPGTARPQLALPCTGGPGTTRLDTRASSQVTLPATYDCPPAPARLLIGRALEADRPVGVSLQPAAASPMLILGGSWDTRQALLDAFDEQARPAGAGVVYFGSADRQVAERPPADLAILHDDDRHFNLLAVPAAPDCAAPAVAEAAALIAALADHIPLLALYLDLLGIPGWNPTSGHRLVLDYAQIWLIVHHRQRIAGDDLQVPAPDLAALLDALADPDVLPELVAAEIERWARPTIRLVRAIDAAGEDGTAAVDLVYRTLEAIQARIEAQPASTRHLQAGQVRTRLASLLNHPTLNRSWADATDAATVFNSATPVELRTCLPAEDTPVARACALHTLVNCLAAARARSRAGANSPPLLLILDEVGWTTSRAVLTQHEALAAGAVTLVLVYDRLPPGPAGVHLLRSATSWYVGTLHPEDLEAVHAELIALGVMVDLPLVHLPAGEALVKVPGASGPVVATIHPGFPPERNRRAA